MGKKKRTDIAHASEYLHGIDADPVGTAKKALKEAYDWEDTHGENLEELVQGAADNVSDVVSDVLKKRKVDLGSRLFENDDYKAILKEIQVEIGKRILEKYHKDFDPKKVLSGDVEKDYQQINQLLGDIIGPGEQYAQEVAQRGGFSYLQLAEQVEAAFRGAVRDNVTWRRLHNRINASKDYHAQQIARRTKGKKRGEFLSRVHNPMHFGKAVHELGVAEGAYQKDHDASLLPLLNNPEEAYRLYEDVREDEVNGAALKPYGIKPAKQAKPQS